MTLLKKMIHQSEGWKDILGYNGCYQVSNTGKVKSVARKKIVTKYNPNAYLPELILKPSVDTGGYLFVSLLNNGKKKRHRVHKLVASHFLDNYNPNLDINHLDGIKANNNICNLENISRSENIKHAYKNGLRRVGIKLSAEQAFEIKYKNKGISQREIAQSYNIFQTTVSDIRRGRLWKHI